MKSYLVILGLQRWDLNKKKMYYKTWDKILRAHSTKTTNITVQKFSLFYLASPLKSIHDCIYMEHVRSEQLWAEHKPKVDLSLLKELTVLELSFSLLKLVRVMFYILLFWSRVSLTHFLHNIVSGWESEEGCCVYSATHSTLWKQAFCFG